MLNQFDRDFVGLQIDWGADDEIEYLSLDLLLGSGNATAATCAYRGRTVAYTYPVLATRRGSSLELLYAKDPPEWHRFGDWDLVKGMLTIKFPSTDSAEPRSIVWRRHDTGEIFDLVANKDWRFNDGTKSADVQVVPRGRSLRSSLERPGQARLKAMLVAQYGKCLLTGVTATSSLEACHLLPVKNGGEDRVENAILLRRDLHALFDAGMLSVIAHGNDWEIRIADSVADQEYRDLHGRTLSDRSLPGKLPYLRARAELGAGGA